MGDLDGDGVSDIIGYVESAPSQDEPGYLAAVSGVSGTEIWKYTAEDFDPIYSINPPFGAGLGVVEKWPDINGDGVEEFIAPGTFIPHSGGGHHREFWVMDGATATVLQIMELGFDSLKPWIDVMVPPESGIQPICDLDDDGWPEGTTFVNVDPGIPYPGAHQAIIGVESLSMPSAVSSGIPFDFNIHIPSSPRLDYVLYFSTKFAPGNGAHHFGKWNTNLRLDLASKILNGLPGSTGSLDQLGKASGSLTLPAGIGLEGKTLYTRGVILDPGKPYGIKTLTTLSTISVNL